MTQQHLSRWERFWTGPIWLKFAACIAVGLAFGLLLGAAVTKASGQQPTSPLLVTALRLDPSERCDPTAETPCPAEARWHAKKFRNGHVAGWKDGVPVKKFYIKPAAVRKVWVHKITRLLKQRAEARGTGARTLDYRAKAIEKYTQLVTQGSCATWQTHYASWDSNHELCTRSPDFSAEGGRKEKWMTADEVKAYGAAALCAGGTVATVVAIPPTAGTSAVVAVGFGGLSCIYSLWAALS